MKGTIRINVGPPDATASTIWTDERDKEVVFKNLASFTNCINEINNTQEDNAKNVLMPMYNLIEHCDNYSPIYGGLWQYFKDEPGRADNPAITDSR